MGVLTEEDDTKVVLVDVQCNADQATGELEQLGGHDARKTLDTGNTVRDGRDVPDGFLADIRLPALELGAPVEVQAESGGDVERLEHDDRRDVDESVELHPAEPQPSLGAAPGGGVLVHQAGDLITGDSAAGVDRRPPGAEGGNTPPPR